MAHWLCSVNAQRSENMKPCSADCAAAAAALIVVCCVLHYTCNDINDVRMLNMYMMLYHSVSQLHVLDVSCSNSTYCTAVI